MISKAIILGRIGNVDFKYTSTQRPVLNLSVATSKKWNDKTTGNLKEKTNWHKVALFGKRAEALQKFVKKGMQVYVEGELDYNEYEKDGIKRMAVNINAFDIQVMSAPKEKGPTNVEQQANKMFNEVIENNTFSGDDIPF